MFDVEYKDTIFTVRSVCNWHLSPASQTGLALVLTLCHCTSNNPRPSSRLEIPALPLQGSTLRTESNIQRILAYVGGAVEIQCIDSGAGALAVRLESHRRSVILEGSMNWQMYKEPRKCVIECSPSRVCPGEFVNFVLRKIGGFPTHFLLPPGPQFHTSSPSCPPIPQIHPPKVNFRCSSFV